MQPVSAAVGSRQPCAVARSHFQASTAALRHHQQAACARGEPVGRRELIAGAVVGGALVHAAGASQVAEPSAPEAPAPALYTSARTEVDSYGVERLALQPEGWNTWRWRGQNVNWLAAGDSGPAVVLIHGFGASAYHFRYVVPQLSQHCRVFALDCLGFGWSDKPLLQYDGYEVWKDQIAAFLREVVGVGGGGGGAGQESSRGGEAVLVGNSLGGYNALATAAAHPDLVRGVVLLNAAGRFDDATGDAAAAPAADAAAEAASAPSLLADLRDALTAALKRGVIGASFYLTKQPARIRQVLGQVYVSRQNIDEDLVRSIARAAEDPNAAEVFYRIITASGASMNRLLGQLDGMPLLLLWGARDPWCVPARADQIQRVYPAAERVDIDSGHCPHDDTPQLVNGELLRWVRGLEA